MCGVPGSSGVWSYLNHVQTHWDVKPRVVLTMWGLASRLIGVLSSCFASHWIRGIPTECKDATVRFWVLRRKEDTKTTGSFSIINRKSCCFSPFFIIIITFFLFFFFFLSFFLSFFLPFFLFYSSSFCLIPQDWHFNFLKQMGGEINDEIY